MINKIVWILSVEVLSLLAMLFGNTTMMIIMNFATMAIIFIVCKVSVISILSLAYNWIVSAVLVQYYTGHSYGMLELNLVPIHLRELMYVSLLYNALLLLLAGVFRVPSSEKQMLNFGQHIKSSRSSIIFCNFVAVAFTIVAFPRLRMQTDGAERFAMLLPGTAWNQLAIIGLLFNLPYLRERRDVQFSYIFVISWFLLNGERADIAGLMLGIFCFFIVSSNTASFKLAWKYIPVAVIALYIMILVGNVRNGNDSAGGGLVSTLTSALTFSTVSDVGYLLNASIDYSLRFAKLHGLIFGSNLYQLLPFTSPSVDFTSVMMSSYGSPGGEPIVSAGLMDWGTIGIVLTTFVDLGVIKLLTLKRNKLMFMEFALILCSIPRLVWYGRHYDFSGMLYFIPLMLIATTLLDKLTDDTGQS